MKEIQVGQEIRDLAGKVVIEGFKVKSVLANMLGACRAEGGEQAVRLMRLGIRLVDAGDTFQFEDADEALLRYAINQNGPGYTALVVAQIWEILSVAKIV